MPIPHPSRLATRFTFTLALLGAPLASLTGAALAQSQVAPETPAVGDIPDSQAFVRYANPSGGYSLEVPEGWARTEQGAKVSFVSKLGAVDVQVNPASSAPTLATLRASVLKRFGPSDPAFKVTALKSVSLPAGPALLAQFRTTGAPNAVTGKASALENALYVLFKGERQLELRFSALEGSDNADAWTRMARALWWR